MNENYIYITKSSPPFIVIAILIYFVDSFHKCLPATTKIYTGWAKESLPAERNNFQNVK